MGRYGRDRGDATPEGAVEALEEEHERPVGLVENEDVFTDSADRTGPAVLGAPPDEEGGQKAR